MTLRELLIRHESYQLASWDHTTAIVLSLQSLIVLVHNALGGKPKLTPPKFDELHPLRRVPSAGATKRSPRLTRKTLLSMESLFEGIPVRDL